MTQRRPLKTRCGFCVEGWLPQMSKTPRYQPPTFEECPHCNGTGYAPMKEDS